MMRAISIIRKQLKALKHGTNQGETEMEMETATATKTEPESESESNYSLF